MLLSKLEELSKDEIYDNPYTSSTLYQRISGTIKCY